MLSLPLMRDPGGGVPRPRLHPARAIVGARGILVIAGLIAACGGNPAELPLPTNDTCLGTPVAVRSLTDTVPVGDSVHVVALPTPAFTSCHSGVPFVVGWEARPDSAVVLSADSDTSVWVRGVAVGTVAIFARVTSGISGLMTLVVRPPN